MRKPVRIAVVAASIAMFGFVVATPANAGKPVPGGVYKGQYVWDGMSAKVRIKVFENGEAGNFSLKCAGVRRGRFEIDRRGSYQNEYAGGASGDLVKGRGKFAGNGTVSGKITKIEVDGAECAAPGEYTATIADV